MKTIRVRGVGCTKSDGGREVLITRAGVRHYYGVYGTLEQANARARHVWRLAKLTGHLPRVIADGDRPIGECELAPVE